MISKYDLFVILTRGWHIYFWMGAQQEECDTSVSKSANFERRAASDEVVDNDRKSVFSISVYSANLRTRDFDFGDVELTQQHGVVLLGVGFKIER